MLANIQRELIYIWYYFDIQFHQIFKYWMAGIVVGSFISVFLKNTIHNIMLSMNGKLTGYVGIVVASILGVASPLCMYGTIPMAASFSKGGMKDDWLAAFMMSSILLNPQLILYSAALGNTAFWLRIILSILCGILAGIFIRCIYKEKSFFNFTGFEEPKSHDTDPNYLIRYLKNVGRNIKVTGPYFLIGILLSALFQRYVPSDLVADLFGGNNSGFGVLMAATIGVPLYACGGGTIPLLQAWLCDGMSMGSASAFMITGPATKITNLGAVKIILGWRRFVCYLAYVMTFAFLSGIIINVIT